VPTNRFALLIYTPWPPDDWNELDIECLGQSTSEVQFNHMINIPPADPETGHLQFPRLVGLGFDPTAEGSPVEFAYSLEIVPASTILGTRGALPALLSGAPL
jgi:endo-1,3-1,4-beta-glycanase ExoK